MFEHSPDTPRELGHMLHRAPVRSGKLTIRVDRASLDALIRVTARASPTDRREERALASLLRYLESLEDRFADPEPDAETDQEPSR